MPRRLRIDTRELGRLELFLIYATASGVWEDAWRPAQDHAALDGITRTTKAVVDHALHGWTKPLVDALGPIPAGCLRKLPLVARECAVRKRCPHYEKTECFPTAKKMPWCYEPDGIPETAVAGLVSEAISMWRRGVYVCVVREEA